MKSINENVKEELKKLGILNEAEILNHEYTFYFSTPDRLKFQIPYIQPDDIRITELIKNYPSPHAFYDMMDVEGAKVIEKYSNKMNQIIQKAYDDVVKEGHKCKEEIIKIVKK